MSKDVMLVNAAEVSVEISSSNISLKQGDAVIVLRWEAFAKLSDAVSAIAEAHALLWRVNKPEAKS